MNSKPSFFHFLTFADELPCDTLGNNYKYILGNCFYFEATAYNFTKSSENCKNRFGDFGIGRLFEPRIEILNNKVITEARKTIGGSDFFYLGIQDSNSQNNWQYVSNNKTISWSNWHYESQEPNNYNSIIENCIGTWPQGDNSEIVKWADIPCTSSQTSICEMTTEGILVYDSSHILVFWYSVDSYEMSSLFISIKNLHLARSLLR